MEPDDLPQWRKAKKGCDMAPETEYDGLRRLIHSGRPLFGVLVKTPYHQTVEVIGHAGLDFVMLDQEHASYDGHALDTCLLACRATGLAGIVRLPELSEHAVLSVLDMGAAGIIFPHVSTGEDAKRAVAFSRYAGGTRGFSNSTRAGAYATRTMSEHVPAADKSIAIVAMIEDPEGVANAAAIVATPGLDMIIVGHADLALSLGLNSIDAPEVVAAEAKIMEAAQRVGLPVGVMVTNAFAVAPLYARGARLFLLGIDQTILRIACTSLVKEARATVP
jgi:2-keto-3-deoxy-L-rhamnonate aldolase RhmA